MFRENGLKNYDMGGYHAAGARDDTHVVLCLRTDARCATSRRSDTTSVHAREMRAQILAKSAYLI